MRILGIDPGYAIVGWGVLEYTAGRFAVCGYDALTTTPENSLEERISLIYDGICTLIDRYKPEAMAIEQLFYATNQKTVIWVAQARGVILLAAVQAGLPIFEYTPLQVKQAVTGYGKADKGQMIEMTRRLLTLPAAPKPDDVADALAVAICHAHSAGPLGLAGRRTGAARPNELPAFGAAVLARNAEKLAALAAEGGKRR